MFYVSLDKIHIRNNRELIGKAEIQIMSFINYGDADFPQFKLFFDSNDEEVKTRMVEDAARQVISSRVTTPVYKIKDHHTLEFGDTGYIVHEAQKIPDDFNWMLLLVELDDKTRDNAKLAEKVVTKKNVSTLVKTISQLAGVSNPVSAAITTLSQYLAKAIVQTAKKDKDDQIGLLLASFIREVHYPQGRRTGDKIPDLTRNMFIDYTIFGF